MNMYTGASATPSDDGMTSVAETKLQSEVGKKALLLLSEPRTKISPAA